MRPTTVGKRVRVIRNENNHSYTIGGVYTVCHVDNDGTFRAAEPGGRTGNWIRWSDCEPADGAAWSQIAATLPEPLVRFLSCFDGIEAITFKEPVVDAVLKKLPDLHERILVAAATPSGELAIAGSRPQELGRPTEQ